MGIEYILHLSAPNDRNGNPRRVYFLVKDGEAVNGWEAEYKGSGAVPIEYRYLTQSCVTVNVSAKELKSFLQEIK